MLGQLLDTIFVVILGILASILYFMGTNFVLDKVMNLPALGSETRREVIRNAIRPWLFIAPALFLLVVYTFYPVIATFILSFMDASSDKFVGLRNYAWIVNDSTFLLTIRNNFLWFLIVPALSTALGLVIAVLADRVWWGHIAKTLIFMPMAISMVGASVIWKFMYDYREGDQQIGLVNAIVQGLGFEPQTWLQMNSYAINSFFLMAILVWIQTGFAMVILSAALRGVPEDTIEAATLDGATGVQIFFKIMIPQVMSTIVVVWTTIVITVLKVFDIVQTMTNGQFDTQVLANLMYDWMFRGGDFGISSAIAMVLMLAVAPVMYFNVRRFRTEETQR